MGVEIERKFTVIDDHWHECVEKSVRMAQGYLKDAAALRDGTQLASIRVRIADTLAYLTIKSRELGRTRQEFEYEIPLADAQALLKLCVGRLIEKIRHHVMHAGFLWEVDVFEGENIGLIVAEIELPRADTTFDMPDWAGRDVTDTPRYYNLALAERPYAQWLPEEKV